MEKFWKNDVWYYLDPDNRKNNPETPHCARCKRKLKETQSIEGFINIELHPDNPWFRIPVGIPKIHYKLIGTKCLEKVINEYGEIIETTQ